MKCLARHRRSVGISGSKAYLSVHDATTEEVMATVPTALPTKPRTTHSIDFNGGPFNGNAPFGGSK